MIYQFHFKSGGVTGSATFNDATKEANEHITIASAGDAASGAVLVLTSKQLADLASWREEIRAKVDQIAHDMWNKTDCHICQGPNQCPYHEVEK